MTVSVNMYEVAKQHIFSFDNCDGSNDTCRQSLFVCFRELDKVAMGIYSCIHFQRTFSLIIMLVSIVYIKQMT